MAIHQEEGSLQLSYMGKAGPDAIAYPIVRSLADTLAAVPADRIRKCEHDDCLLRFVDTSKSGKRRWCSMETCGNRHKAAEFYAKRRRRAEG
ncbi:CGNR zinc finger domain-containing protein [Cohnella xylanilytica]|uniref:CGNR zinc finger domain-containing protein n=2 Tax=Cohnella xylanilytica TaxID=557555 RepID=A0A841U1V6_9BACL|nr:CGNR zinc finger domain-containing protein [Cohnella xylanilytica]